MAGPTGILLMTRREARSTTVREPSEVEIGAEDGGAMLAEKNDDGEDEKEGEEEVDAEVFGVGHEGV